MMSQDDFESFMRQWTKEHVRPNELHGDPDDVKYAATLRSDALTLFAAQNGCYKALKEKAAPYGGVVQYVVSLFDGAKRANRAKT
jgi:hypothetical protein